MPVWRSGLPVSIRPVSGSEPNFFKTRGKFQFRKFSIATRARTRTVYRFIQGDQTGARRFPECCRVFALAESLGGR